MYLTPPLFGSLLNSQFYEVFLSWLGDSFPFALQRNQAVRCTSHYSEDAPHDVNRQQIFPGQRTVDCFGADNPANCGGHATG